MIENAASSHAICLLSLSGKCFTPYISNESFVHVQCDISLGSTIQIWKVGSQARVAYDFMFSTSNVEKEDSRLIYMLYSDPYFMKHESIAQSAFG